MKGRCVIIALAATAVGAAAGWFAAGTANSSADDIGRARCPQRADCGGLGQAALPAERSNATARAVAAKPKRKAPIRSTADAEVKRRALEKRVRFLEDSIRIAKEKQPPKALDANTASNEEIVERLMKLPSEWERDKELERLGTNRLYTFTMSQLGKLCPKKYAAPGRDAKALHDRMLEKTAERLAILDSVDQSLMTEEEKARHCELADALARLPELYAEKMSLEDGSFGSRTLGDVVDGLIHLISNNKRREVLLAEERKTLISQAAKHFDMPDDAAADLLSAMDDVADATDDTFFYRKK